MKKSLRLLVATLVMAAAVAAASISQKQLAEGSDPMPMCPPGGCVLTN